MVKEGGGGGATCSDLRQVCAPAESKRRPITRAKFFIEKPPKPMKMTWIY